MRPGLRFEVFKRDNFTCRYCGKSSPEAILEADHVVPVSAGGTDEPENLVTSCYECNRGKGARLLSDVPVEADLHEKTIAIAEREHQLMELNHWRAKQREREDRDILRLFRYWEKNTYYHSAPSFQDGSVRTFLRHLCYEDVFALMRIAVEYRGINESRQWRYFCGACWNQIKNPEPEE